MSEKKELIKNGGNVSLTDGNIIVLNDVSLVGKEPVEAKEEQVKESDKTTGEEVTPSEVAPVVDTVEKEENTPVIPATEVNADKQQEIPVIPITPAVEATPSIDVAPIDLTNIFGNNPEPEDSTKYPNASLTPNTEVKDDNAFSFPSQFSSSNNSLFSKQEASNNTLNNFDSGVFKTEADVDRAFDEFMSDAKKSYDEHISNPTKTLVAFAEKFVNWGNQVTANGLNRRLFDEYDELIALYNSYKSYSQSTSINNLGSDYNNNTFSSYGDDQNTNDKYSKAA